MTGPAVPQSPLGRLASREPASLPELRALAARVWRDRGVVVLFPEDVHASVAATVRREAERLYGKRIGGR